MHKNICHKSIVSIALARAVQLLFALGALIALHVVGQAQAARTVSPSPEEGWFSPFYLLTPLLIAALIFQILYLRRRRTSNRTPHARERAASQSDFHFSPKETQAKRKGKFNKEEMSSLLKASASPTAGPTAAARAAHATEPEAEPEATPVAEPVAKIAHRFAQLDPVADAEELPRFADDEPFLDALDELRDPSADVRARAMQTLAQFRTQNSVTALTHVLSNDVMSSVRTTAALALGELSHESVMIPLLSAGADKSQDVRSAAAKALASVTFDRAAEYARIVQSGDVASLRRAALGCRESGAAAGAIERLGSLDEREAYEAYALLTMMSRAGEKSDIEDAADTHPSIEIREILRNIA